jgi:hypothetical protein
MTSYEPAPIELDADRAQHALDSMITAIIERCLFLDNMIDDETIANAIIDADINLDDLMLSRYIESAFYLLDCFDIDLDMLLPRIAAARDELNDNADIN